MKTLKIILVLLYFIARFTNAQIDTTDWFPMQTGNYWEYWDNAGSTQKLFIKIVGDTTFNNGEDYNDWTWFTDTYYRKEVGNKIYEYTFDAGCLNSERLLYDFDAKDSTFWPSCISIPPFNIYIAQWYSSEAFFPFYPRPLESKTYTYVTVDTTVIPNDTSWFFLGFKKVAKGIGFYESLYDFAPWYYLVGAIINNQQYGSITNIETNNILTNESEKLSLSVYPNPFNSQCRVIIENLKISNNVIIVYNSLGQKLFELTKEINQNNNIYQFELDLSKYPTGVYFLQIMNSFEIITTKIINMK